MTGEGIVCILLTLLGISCVAIVTRLSPTHMRLEHVLGCAVTIWCASTFVLFLPYSVWATSVPLRLTPIGLISVTVGVSYRVSTFFSWMICPILMECASAGEFTLLGIFDELLRRNASCCSAWVVFVSAVLLWITASGSRLDTLLSGCIAAANSLGVAATCVLMGFGLWAVPRHIWRWADPSLHVKALYSGAVHVNEAKLTAQLELQDTIRVVRAEVASRLKEVLDLKLEKAYDALLFTLDESELILCEVTDGDCGHYARHPNKGCAVARGGEGVTRSAYLSQLHFALKEAGCQARREGCQWKALVSRCLFIEDLEQNVVPSVAEMVASWQGRIGGILARRRLVRKACHWILVFWLRTLRRCVFRFLSCVCALLSIAILIGQITMNLNIWPFSSLQLLFRAERGFFFTQALCSVLLGYMFGTTFWSLFRLKSTRRRGGLYSGKADEPSLLWYSSTFAWVAGALCYHFLLLIRVEGTALQVNIDDADTVSPLVASFNRACAISTCCLCACHMFGKYSGLVRIFRCEGLEFDFVTLRDPKTNDAILEGRRLLDRERTRRAEEKDMLEHRNDGSCAAELDQMAGCIPLRCQISKMIEEGLLPAEWNDQQ